MKILSLSERIEQHLKEEILSGKLKPGQRLTIDEIAEQLEVSAMPVRDAVRRLDTQGFLTVAPRRGVFVTKFDQSKFKNIMDIRVALECLAVELSVPHIPLEEIEQAAQRYRDGGEHLAETGDKSLLAACDNLVHDLIINYSNNPELIEIMNQQKDLINWGHRIVATYQPDANQRALPEHLQILKQLAERDVQSTQDALRFHLNNTFKRTIEAWDMKLDDLENGDT